MIWAINLLDSFALVKDPRGDPGPPRRPSCLCNPSPLSLRLLPPSLSGYLSHKGHVREWQGGPRGPPDGGGGEEPERGQAAGSAGRCAGEGRRGKRRRFAGDAVSVRFVFAFRILFSGALATKLLSWGRAGCSETKQSLEFFSRARIDERESERLSPAFSKPREQARTLVLRDCTHTGWCHS